jgi:hypothetical protein
MERDISAVPADCERKLLKLRKAYKAVWIGFGLSTVFWGVLMLVMNHQVSLMVKQIKAGQTQAADSAVKGAVDAVKNLQPEVMAVGYTLGYRDCSAGRPFPKDVAGLMNSYITAGKNQSGLPPAPGQ